jgi:NAD+ kinase
VGGDGTLLYVARKFLHADILFMGINFGRVGFLAEICPDGWEAEFTEIFVKGNFFVSKRIALNYKVERDGSVVSSGCSINDVVVCRDGLARLLEISIKIGKDKGLLNFRADGVIISSPNGSTGYCAAAGGSLIFPSLNVIEICPISPFLSRIKPLIVPDHMSVFVEINGTYQDAFLTIDGQEGFKLSAGDRVEISKHKHKLCFLMPKNTSYISKLKEKGYI